MITISNQFPALSEAFLEYLLIGDVLDLLNSSPSYEHRRWLLTILDHILMGNYLSELRRVGHSHHNSLEDKIESDSGLSLKAIKLLKQLRDRIAHGTNYAHYAHEMQEIMAELVQHLRRHYAGL